MKRAAVLAIIPCALAALAGGGGGGGSVRYAPTVVPIKHLDLDGVELTVQDFLHPSFANRYPSVVAEVNGQPVTGEALAREQVSLEFQRRGAIETPLSLGLGIPSLQEALQERTDIRLEAIESIDPLEAAIDSALELQAAKRLKLIPSGPGAVELARQAQLDAENAIASASPEQRAAFEENLRVQGLHNTDWTTLPGIVETFAVARGLMALRHAKCKNAQTPAVSVSGRDHCTAFLAEEREHADIVYYVRWSD
jgi:hypothetical protein